MKNFFKIFYNRNSQNENYIASDDDRDYIINDLLHYLKDIREIFFKECIETVKSCNPKCTIINRRSGGVAEIVLKSFQFLIVVNNLSRYIEPDEQQEFIDKLFYLMAGKHYSKCSDFVESYKELEKSKIDKRIFIFSIDIGKYICGYDSDLTPSSYPCLNSYITKGMPVDIHARIDVTKCALSVANIAQKLSALTDMALAFSFQDNEYGKAMEQKIKNKEF